MSQDLARALVLVVSILLLTRIAVVVAWTPAAAVAWLVSVPLFIAFALLPLPLPLRLGIATCAFAWCAILLFPERSPIGPLSRSEWAMQRVIRHVSVAAREAFLASRIADTLPALIGELDASEPPNEMWHTVKAAQLLDLRADPPQVGVGDATQRLVSWPWRAALDHRVLRARIRLQDALRARKLRHIERPGFDDMTSSMQYDYYFLKNAWHRFNALEARDGGLADSHEEARALVALIAAVRPPSDDWAIVRDLTVEVQALQLKAATESLSRGENDRAVVAGEELRVRWSQLSRRDAQGMAWPDEAAPGGHENQSTRVG